MKKDCLKGRVPYLLQLNTYRWREHCGPNYDNHLGYRSVKEFEKWKKNCPILQYEKKLKKNKILNDKIKNNIITANKKIIDKAFNFAIKSSFPNYKSANLNVYAK